MGTIVLWLSPYQIIIIGGYFDMAKVTHFKI